MKKVSKDKWALKFPCGCVKMHQWNPGWTHTSTKHCGKHPGEASLVIGGVEQAYPRGKAK